MSGVPATRRVDRGKGHSYYIDGVKADGVTTVINGGLPKPALVGWAAKAVAEQVCNRRSLLTEMTDPEIMDFLKGAPFRDRDQAGNRGTEVHRIAAMLSEGATVQVPSELVGPVDAYIRWLEDWKPSFELVEATVINRRYGYAGTLDIVASFEGMGRGLIDAKTNRSGPFGEVGIQAVAYGRAETYLSDGVEVPMPRIDFYGCLWLTPDSYEFYRLDVGDREFRAFLYAQQIHRWTEERSKSIVMMPALAPARRGAA